MPAITNRPVPNFSQPSVQTASLHNEHGSSIAQLEEDEEDIAIMKQRATEPLLGLNEVMKKYGQQ